MFDFFQGDICVLCTLDATGSESTVYRIYNLSQKVLFLQLGSNFSFVEKSQYVPDLLNMVYCGVQKDNVVFRVGYGIFAAYRHEDNDRHCLERCLGLLQPEKHSCEPRHAMMRRQRCFFVVALVNFTLSVP